MSPVAATGPATRGGAATPPRHRRRRPAPSMSFDALFGEAAEARTFDDVLVGTWEGLAAHRTVACPVCGSAAMRPRHGAGPGVAGGRCGDCGTVLG